MSVDRNIELGLLEMQVLWLLGKRGMHGYALMQELSAIKKNRLTQGTLYPVLSKLVEKGLIVASRPGPRGRKTYSLTAEGAELKERTGAEFVQIYSGMIHDYSCSNCPGHKRAFARPYKQTYFGPEHPIQLVSRRTS